ncbi:hypothetical protein GGR56DRAFT_211160 [Xylariaceae sp. FL0804]|nr:hypothetical protein GGR56DRAFT_211160 [Xylariaceae sp. FL0804]
MYAGNYGFPNNAAASPYSGAPPPAHQQNTPPTQIMYNSHQFPLGPQPGAGFPGNPNMMPGAGPAGMMPNPAMPHMASNGQMPNYQTPYSNSPYGAGIPASAAPHMNVPTTYAMGGGMPMPGFPGQQGMNPQQQQQQQQQQQMMQRMHTPQSSTSGMSTPNPQRHVPGQPPRGSPTPNSAQPSQQSQFPPPSNPPQGTQQGQMPNNGPPHQAHPTPGSNHIQTPQTPTFPPSIHLGGPNGTSTTPGPLSPGADSKDKERFGVILEINNELLLEAMQIQITQQAFRKERANTNGVDNMNDAEKKSTEEEDQLAQDYVQCMRRISTNLSYLATLADRKSNTAAQPCPAYLKAPPLNTSIKLRQVQGPDSTEVASETTDREETAKYIAELYKKLQALYPGVDPNKEPPNAISSGRPINTSKTGSQTPGQASPVPGKQDTPILANAGTPQAVHKILGAP